MNITGTVERDPPIFWDDRGIGLLKLVEHEKPIRIKELQKPYLPKDLKPGDKITAEVDEGDRYYFLISLERERTASLEETGSIHLPPAEQPPKLTEDYNIPYSAKKIGELYPILVDPEGNIIDGLHRHDHDPNWRKEVVPWVRSRKDFLIARIHANLHRRDVPKEERQRDFTELANILVNEGEVKGKLAEKISELTGFSIDWVRDLLPQSYKLREKSQAGKAAHPSAGLKPAQGVTSPKTSGVQSPTLPDKKVDLEEEAKKRALAVDSALPQNYADLYVGPCPACGVKIQWDQERKIFARVN